MIVDRISNVDLYINLHPLFKEAFNFLENPDIADIAEGEHLIKGRDLYAKVEVYNTKAADEDLHEAHRRYIDIQFIVDGKEYVGYAPLVDQRVAEEYREEVDIAFYYESSPSFIALSTGMFAIFFPEDAHKPCRYLESSSRVKKIVVKIAV
jgi:YhcH/YjgK/YiaL family protein